MLSPFENGASMGSQRGHGGGRNNGSRGSMHGRGVGKEAANHGNSESWVQREGRMEDT